MVRQPKHLEDMGELDLGSEPDILGKLVTRPNVWPPPESGLRTFALPFRIEIFGAVTMEIDAARQ